MKNLTKFLPTLALIMVLAMVGSAQALVLDGNVLRVGVDQSGGLVDLGASQGITYKPVLPGTSNDFTLPGTPWEFYSIGVNGSSVVGGVTGTAQNPLGLVTVDWSGGGTMLTMTTDGAYSLGGGLLTYTQQVAFDTNSNVMKVSATFYNVGSTLIQNLVYARGMDPDQDVNKFSSFVTNNTILGPGSVQAIGPLTGLYVRMDSLVPGGVASISDSTPAFPWETDPYNLLAGGLLNGALAGNPWDYTINMAWAIGDLAPGRSYEVDFTYTFGQVPLPPSVLLLGSGLLGLGLVGWRRRKES
jgi:hypothetical protein